MCLVSFYVTRRTSKVIYITQRAGKSSREEEITRERERESGGGEKKCNFSLHLCAGELFALLRGDLRTHEDNEAAKKVECVQVDDIFAHKQQYKQIHTE